jgi:hypothetical protein
MAAAHVKPEKIAALRQKMAGLPQRRSACTHSLQSVNASLRGTPIAFPTAWPVAGRVRSPAVPPALF